MEKPWYENGLWGPFEVRLIFSRMRSSPIFLLKILRLYVHRFLRSENRFLFGMLPFKTKNIDPDKYVIIALFAKFDFTFTKRKRNLRIYREEIIKHEDMG